MSQKLGQQYSQFMVVSVPSPLHEAPGLRTVDASRDLPISKFPKINISQFDETISSM